MVSESEQITQNFHPRFFRELIRTTACLISMGSLFPLFLELNLGDMLVELWTLEFAFQLVFSMEP